MYLTLLMKNCNPANSLDNIFADLLHGHVYKSLRFVEKPFELRPGKSVTMIEVSIKSLRCFLLSNEIQVAEILIV